MNNPLDDTIIALCTPAAPAALAVMRLSGPEAFQIMSRRWKGHDIAAMKSHTVALGYILDEEGNEIDNVLITKFKAPHSFTGEDTIEISSHGSPRIASLIVKSLIHAGARHALNGEFSRKAFLNRRIDLTQAEAIADLIASSSKISENIAIRQLKGSLSEEIDRLSQDLLQLASLLELELDFSEENVEFAPREQLIDTCNRAIFTLSQLIDSYSTGQAFKNGINVAIAGIPNAGKSTLLNAILGDEKAIVSDIPGTTRDIIDDTREINGLLFRFFDTAGLRDTSDTIEQAGIQRTLNRISKSDIIILLLDATKQIELQIDEFLKHDTSSQEIKLLPVINKTDLSPLSTLPKLPDNWLSPLTISAKNSDNVRNLLDTIFALASKENHHETQVFLTNRRHYSLALKARESLEQTLNALRNGIPSDLVAQHIRYALDHLGEITGKITSAEILTSIFSSFCIGK